LHDLGQEAVKEHQREPDQYERRAVPGAPQEAHETGLPHLVQILFRRDERRHRRQVVGVRGVAQPEQGADQQDHAQARRAVHEAFEPTV
jgi:hypothetical protein